MKMIDFLQGCLQSTDGKLLYLIAIISGLMMLDFCCGTVCAIFRKDIEYRSKEGIFGILRKLISIAVMFFMIPIAVLIPGDMGILLLYTLYTGYMILEFKSIVENLDRMGVDVGPFRIFLNNFEKFIRNTEDKREDKKNKM